MTWLYPAEIVPLRIRAPANALATSANWVCCDYYIHRVPDVDWLQAFNFMVVMVTPIAFASIQYKTYIVFAVMYAFPLFPSKKPTPLILPSPYSNAFMIPVIYFFYPETAYRSLEEMDTIFRKCNSYLTIVKIAQEEPRRYDKHGKPLVNYEETEEHRRRASAWSGHLGDEEKARVAALVEHAGSGNKVERGYAGEIHD